MSLELADFAPDGAAMTYELDPSLSESEALTALDRILEEVVTPLEICYLAKDDVSLFLTEFKETLVDHDGIWEFITTYPLSIIEHVPNRVTNYQYEGIEEYRRETAANYDNPLQYYIRHKALVHLACYLAFEIEAVLYDDPHEDEFSRVFNEDVDIDIDVAELKAANFSLNVANTAP